MDQTVTMTDVEWSQVMAVLANATGPGINWSVTNPLLMKIGEQLRQQTAGAQQGLGQLPMSRGDGLGHDRETSDLPAHVRTRQARPS